MFWALEWQLPLFWQFGDRDRQVVNLCIGSCTETKDLQGFDVAQMVLVTHKVLEIRKEITAQFGDTADKGDAKAWKRALRRAAKLGMLVQRGILTRAGLIQDVGKQL